MAFISGCLAIGYTLRVSTFRANPISTLMVLGFALTTSLTALIPQTVGLKPIVFNLVVPERTFIVVVCAQIIAIAAHYVYANSVVTRSFRSAIARRVYAPLGLFIPPTNAQLWIFGLIGLASLWFTKVDRYGEDNYGDAGLKFLEGFTGYAVAPFLILGAALLFGTSPRKIPKTALGIYFAALVLTGLAVNSRGTFSNAILLSTLVAALSVLCGLFELRRDVLASMLKWGAVGAIVLPVFSDIATAMVIARSERYDNNFEQTAGRTIDVFFDGDAIANFKQSSETPSSLGFSEYNEIYLDNPFLQRFNSVKYLDLNLELVARLSEGNSIYVLGNSWQQLIAMLPTPIARLIDPSIDKMALQYSSGDFYNYIVGGMTLGSFITGASLADGLAIFGPMVWPTLFVFLVFKFAIFDGFVQTVRGDPVFSCVILMMLMRVVLWGITGESVVEQIAELLRGIPQMIFLYVAIFWASRLLLAVMLGTAPRERLT